MTQASLAGSHSSNDSETIFKERRQSEKPRSTYETVLNLCPESGHFETAAYGSLLSNPDSY